MKHLIYILLLLSQGLEARSPSNYNSPQSLLQFAAIYPWTIDKNKNCMQIMNLKSRNLSVLKNSFCDVQEEDNYVLMTCEQHKGKFGFFKSQNVCQAFVSETH